MQLEWDCALLIATFNHATFFENFKGTILARKGIYGAVGLIPIS